MPNDYTNEDSTRTWYEIDGKLWLARDVNIDPVGGDSETRRALTPDGKAIGRRGGQIETWSCTGEQDVTDSDSYIDFSALKRANWRGTLTEHAGIRVTNYYNVAVENVKGTSGENGKTESITLSMLDKDPFQA